MDYYDGMPDPDEIPQHEMESRAEQQEEHFKRTGRGSLDGTLVTSSDWDSLETNRSVAGCPNDTDGDGNCGRPACPWCSSYRKSQDIGDTPVPQRSATEY